MRVLVVDDERLALEDIVSSIKQISDVKVVYSFQSPKEAIQWTKNNPIDIAFLDVTMFEMNGLTLALELKKIIPNIWIVFVTAYDQYTLEAFKLKANGYLLKPSSVDSIKEEVEYFLKSRNLNNKKVKINTFGNFEIYVDGKPLKFSRSKSKELLGYLVDKRGTPTKMSELIVNLWEDRDNDRSGRSMLHNVISDMMKTLREQHAEDIIIKSRNNLQLDINKVDCDYFQLLKGDSEAINSYMGEYMSNYTWAEFTSAYLYDKVKNVK